MLHVDEGALHAYLDGALDEYPAAEARRIREHIEVCAVCADQLLTERRLREEVRAILGRATPDIEVPTLEELRAYVRASRPRRTPASLRLYRLGWAASVVLAIGVGWMLRGGRSVQPMVTRPAAGAVDGLEPVAAGGGTPTVQAPEAENESRASVAGTAGPRASAAQQPVGVLVSSALAPPTVSGSAAPSGSLAEPSRSVIAAAEASATDSVPPRPGDGVVVGDAPAASDQPSLSLDGTVAAALPAPAVLGPAVVVPSPTVSLPDNVVDRPAASPTDDRGDREVEAARRSSQGQVVTSAIAAEPSLAPVAEKGDTDIDESSDSDVGSLVVPGLELIAVLPVSEGRTFSGMRALQRLEDGDTLEVVHLAEGAAPSMLPPVPAGSHEIVLKRGAGWIVLRGPRSEAELLGLLQRLEAGS